MAKAPRYLAIMGSWELLAVRGRAHDGNRFHQLTHPAYCLSACRPLLALDSSLPLSGLPPVSTAASAWLVSGRGRSGRDCLEALSSWPR